jgi:Fic family protein
MDILMGMPLAEIKIPLTQEILRLTSEIDEFKGRWSTTHTLAPEKLAQLRRVATIESIGSSTRIEGSKLSNKDVEVILKGIKAYSFRSRDEQEVAGYAETMEIIFSSFSEIQLTENYIKQLHGVLLKYSEKDQRHRGEYKKLPNNVAAFDNSGKNLGVIFETATPFETPVRMQEIVEWTNNELTKRQLHPLLITAIFVVIFLQIHPFQDGNGRLSRAISTLLLLKAGYLYVPYSSFERVIEDNKEEYYLFLRRAQQTLPVGGDGLGEWVTFFLRCMQKQKTALENKLGTESLLSRLPALSLQIIELVQSRGQATVRDIVAATNANRNTVKAHLKILVANKQLSKEGNGKGTRYVR